METIETKQNGHVIRNI